MNLYRPLKHRFQKLRFYLLYGQFLKRYNLSSMVLSVLKIQGAKYISIENQVYIHHLVWLGAYQIDEHEPVLSIGEGSCIGNFNHITCVRKVIIGKKVLTSDKVYISDNLHSYENPEIAIMDQPVTFKKEVIIGDGAWIGEHVCIIGASVGKNSIIGSNSVVTRDIPDYCIAVGNPARVIKTYNFETKAWEKA